LLAPVGTPRAIIDRVNADVQKALLVPAVRQRLEDMGGEVRGSTPEEMKAMVTRELDKWVQVVADAKIPKQ
jgi:tripartite-type tricarboxylate transporter receptor subunit TctC